MTSILNLPATYTITYGACDITLIAKYVVKCEGRWIGAYPDKEAAEYFAKRHYVASNNQGA